MRPLSPDLGRIYQRLKNSATLEKLAADGVAGAAEEKAIEDRKTFEMIKKAAFGMQMAEQMMHSPLAKGLALGTGIAIPGVIGANMASDHFTSQARDKALQTAGGIGALGMGMYGLHRMMNQPKVASETLDVEDAIQKLAACVYLDEVLPDTELGREIKMLNAEFVCQTFRNLIE